MLTKTDAGLFDLPHEPGAAGFDAQYLKRRCRQAVAHWIERARPLTRGRGVYLQLPEVCFDLRGLSAGMAYAGNRRQPPRIRLNEELLRRYPREMIQHTVPHEVAHLVAHALGGRMDHGAQWQAVMRHFGKPATRCHQMQAQPARQHSKFRYSCGCREHVVGPQINARIRRGQVYHCRRCAGRLQLAS